jgi:hypothetical protein
MMHALSNAMCNTQIQRNNGELQLSIPPTCLKAPEVRCSFTLTGQGRQKAHKSCQSEAVINCGQQVANLYRLLLGAHNQ